MTANTRLATFGTLAPGRVNAHQLQGLEGHWTTGTVRGHLVNEGWGVAHGYPSMVPADDGLPIEVWVFESADLPDHWHRLDAFEGAGYTRLSVIVETREGPLPASLYAAKR